MSSDKYSVTFHDGVGPVTFYFDNKDTAEAFARQENSTVCKITQPTRFYDWLVYLRGSLLSK
jgi:hypothetical protein